MRRDGAGHRRRRGQRGGRWDSDPDPGCTYTLTTGHGNDGVHDPAGLPVITTPITFEGNANTIARAPAAAAFRIAQVDTTGGIYYVAGSATLNTSTVTANTATNCTGSPSPVPGCIG